jgi:hypothetical protein
MKFSVERVPGNVVGCRGAQGTTGGAETDTRERKQNPGERKRSAGDQEGADGSKPHERRREPVMYTLNVE